MKELDIDPERPIFDPHHHLWRADMPYEIGDLWADTQTGHNIVGTVFIECGAEYRTEGPRHLRPVGETEWRPPQRYRYAKPVAVIPPF